MLGKTGKHLVIVSAYQVCHQKFDAVSEMASAQQIRILQATGITKPNPRTIFLTDLIAQINEWKNVQKEVLLCMDSNDQVDNPRAKMSCLFLETDLTDLHHHHYPSLKKPATHQWGGQLINLMAGSPLTPHS